MYLTQSRTKKKLLGPAIALVVWSGFSQEVQAGMVGSLDAGRIANHRESDMNAVLQTLHEEQVKTRLEKMGLNTAEIDQRIRRMSAADLQKAASELSRIKAGKDLVVFAVIGAICFMFYVIGSISVGRAPAPERDLIDVRTKKPTRKIFTPSSSSKGY
jgi:hypothetical protein